MKIQNDGTVEVDLAKSASELLELDGGEGSPLFLDSLASESYKFIPKLKIVILVVGTRGDVQPFLAMAKRLQARVKSTLFYDFFFCCIIRCLY